MSATAFVVILCAIAVWGYVCYWSRTIPQSELDDPERAKREDYAHGGGYIAAARRENRRERERFGDGSFAPSWPPNGSHNSHATLVRGVWVNDAVNPPSNAELDRIRRDYQRTHRQITYTLVAGENVVPMGKNGAMVRVMAKEQEITGPNQIPSISVWPSEGETGLSGTLGMSFSGHLPAIMQKTILVEDERLISTGSSR